MTSPHRSTPQSRIERESDYPLGVPFDRQSAVGNWLYPLASAIAVFFLAAVAVYVLTNVWREHAEGLGVADDAAPAPDPATDATPDPTPAAAAVVQSNRSAAEILDCRLAAGEISIKEYEKLVAALAKRHTAAATAAAAPVMNGAAATPAAV
jgi:hypothetical protein